MGEDSMLAYFLSMIEVRIRRLEPFAEPDPVRKKLLSDIQTALAGFGTNYRATGNQAWCEAYRLERMMTLVEPPENLVSEIDRRLGEAAEEKVQSVGRLHANFETMILIAVDKSQTPPALRAGGEGLLRSFLLDVMEEMHWTLQRKFYSRPLQKNATYRIVYFGLFAFVALLIPYVYVYFRIANGDTVSFEATSWIPLYTSLTAGLFGALFSRLLFLQKNWNDLTLGEIKDARDYSSVLLRGCVGMTGAVMISFFLQSGVLQGGLFPNFAEMGFKHLHYALPNDTSAESIPFRLLYPNEALALLVVWSFLAGFSERLVPSLLQSTELKIEGKPENKT